MNLPKSYLKMLIDLRYLELCRGMWKWLAANPDKGKQDYLDQSDMGAYPSVECWCCQHFEDMNPDKNYWIGGKLGSLCVEHCLLKDLWPGGCEQPESPYAKWLDSSTCTASGLKARALYADEILFACDEAIGKMERSIADYTKHIKKRERPKLKGES